MPQAGTNAPPRCSRSNGVVRRYNGVTSAEDWWRNQLADREQTPRQRTGARVRPGMRSPSASSSTPTRAWFWLAAACRRRRGGRRSVGDLPGRNASGRREWRLPAAWICRITVTRAAIACAPCAGARSRSCLARQGGKRRTVFELRARSADRAGAAQQESAATLTHALAKLPFTYRVAVAMRDVRPELRK